MARLIPVGSRAAGVMARIATSVRRCAEPDQRFERTEAGSARSTSSAARSASISYRRGQSGPLKGPGRPRAGPGSASPGRGAPGRSTAYRNRRPDRQPSAASVTRAASWSRIAWWQPLTASRSLAGLAPDRPGPGRPASPLSAASQNITRPRDYHRPARHAGSDQPVALQETHR